MIGIDIGTSIVKAASVDCSGRASTVSNSRGEPRTPSAVHYPENGTPLVGTDAIEQGYMDPQRCVRNFKLKLGTTTPLAHNTKPITATDATEVLIHAVKGDIERFIGKAVDECVATCPANFRDDSKQALLEAFQRNGIKVSRLLPEPTAAGIAYSMQKIGDRRNIAVFDFGGGTFDASVVRLDGSQLTVMATEGVAKLGGNDLNECLRERVLKEFEAKFGAVPDLSAEPLFHYDLDQRVEAAKISLATRSEVPIVIGYQGGQLVAKITQGDFHQAIDPLVQQSLDALDRAVAAAGLKMNQINHLIMVGGTSRLPHIQDRVANHTGLAPKADIDPDKAIAYGAAMASMVELASQGRTATIRGQVIPAPDMFIRDVTAHAVGCCVADRSQGRTRLINAVMIPKNTPLPCQKVDRFYLESEDQVAAQVEILQGEPDAERDDCLLIGELVLDNLPREAKPSARIQVQYLIDTNGMVTATATDLVSQKTATVSVDYKKGVKPKDKPATV